MQNDEVQTVADYKHHARGNYKAPSQLMPVINRIDHCRGAVDIFNWRGLFNFIDH